MPATKSYLIPVGDLSLSDRQGIRANVDQVITGNALELAIRTNDRDLIIRDTLPFTDLALAAQESWLVPVAAVVAAESQYFSSVVAVDRIIGFYGIALETAPVVFSRLRLTLGATSAQIRGVFQLEQLNARLEPAGYFSEAVVFTRQETVRVLLMARAAALLNTQIVPLFARTVEPIGAVVSAPSV